MRFISLQLILSVVLAGTALAFPVNSAPSTLSKRRDPPSPPNDYDKAMLQLPKYQTDYKNLLTRFTEIGAKMKDEKGKIVKDSGAAEFLTALDEFREILEQLNEFAIQLPANYHAARLTDEDELRNLVIDGQYLKGEIVAAWRMLLDGDLVDHQGLLRKYGQTGTDDPKLSDMIHDVLEGRRKFANTFMVPYRVVGSMFGIAPEDLNLEMF